MSHRKRPKDCEALLRDHKTPRYVPPGIRVSQDFLDLLNGEGAKLSEFMQTPGGIARIQQAAAEAPAKIRELEAEMGLEPPPKPIPREDMVCQEPGCSNPATIGKTCAMHPGVTFVKEGELDRIIEEANQPHVSIEYPVTLRRRFIRMGKRLLESIKAI
jgi:hypothetical protein